jgi:hypothetical protein
MDNSDGINSNVINSSDATDYLLGERILFEAYNTKPKIMVGGGIDLSQAGEILNKIFTPETQKTMTRVIRGATRTTAGVGADIATAGAGGDVATDSLFAVQSSVSFISDVATLIAVMQETKSLFDKLFKLKPSKRIPIESRLKLDNGLQTFEDTFTDILQAHIDKYSPKTLNKVHEKIVSVIDKVTTVVADWVGTLFPDTAGLASEAAKTVLDRVAAKSFTLTYNLIDFMPSHMQQMVTNPYALKDLIRKALAFLKKILRGLKPEQIHEIIASIGKKASESTTNVFYKGAIGVGTHLATYATTKYSGSVGSMTTFGVRPQDMIIHIIEKYVEPNIDFGVDLFYQLFPIFLMFVLFMEKYPEMKGIKRENIISIKHQTLVNENDQPVVQEEEVVEQTNEG